MFLSPSLLFVINYDYFTNYCIYMYYGREPRPVGECDTSLGYLSNLFQPQYCEGKDFRVVLGNSMLRIVHVSLKSMAFNPVYVQRYEKAYFEDS